MVYGRYNELVFMGFKNQNVYKNPRTFSWPPRPPGVPGLAWYSWKVQLFSDGTDQVTSTAGLLHPKCEGQWVDQKMA